MFSFRFQFEEALRWALLVVAAILFAAIARDAFRLEMGDRLHLRYWAHAFPAIISAWDHGLAWDFTAYRGVMELLVNTVVANVLIPDPDAATALNAGERALQAASIASGFDKSIVLVPYDDKGYTDLARISFCLFGVHVPSILKGYLLLLGISVATYLLQFRRNIRALVVLDFVLMGIYAGMFAFPLSRELGQITNPRAIGMLSWVAVVHILCVLLHPVRLNRNGIAAIGIQTSIVLSCLFLPLVRILADSVDCDYRIWVPRLSFSARSQCGEFPPSRTRRSFFRCRNSYTLPMGHFSSGLLRFAWPIPPHLAQCGNRIRPTSGIGQGVRPAGRRQWNVSPGGRESSFPRTSCASLRWQRYRALKSDQRLYDL